MKRIGPYKVVYGDSKVVNLWEEEEKAKWFESHKKDKYSMKDIEEYAYSRYRGLKDSVDEDVRTSMEQQIRRVIRHNFDLKKIDGRYVYQLNEYEVIYLVNDLLSNYFKGLIYPENSRLSLDEKIELLSMSKLVFNNFDRYSETVQMIDAGLEELKKKKEKSKK